MISDELSDAVVNIRSYLDDHLYDDVYQGPIRDEIVDIIKRMDALRVKLDTPPSGAESLEQQGPPHG